MKDKKKNKKDYIIKIVLIIIIIILLIHNCVLIKKDNSKLPTPNGNVDIIEINCNDNRCDVDKDKDKDKDEETKTDDTKKNDTKTDNTKKNNNDNNNTNEDNTNTDNTSTDDNTSDDDTELIEGELNVYDEEKPPVTWNGSTDLKIFTKSIYNVDGVIAPESENVYQFIVKNNTEYNLKYNVDFIETNPYNINMKYKLKKNNDYIIDHYVSADELDINNILLNVSNNDTYYLEWKWISTNNDTEIGTNPNAKYGLKIEIKAESVNG